MRILVVDDTETMRFLLGRYFESLGHEVVALASGRDVPSALEAGVFDAVFTDVAMPDSSGWDVLRTVRAARPGVPVVLVTGWSDGSTGPDGLAADAVLDKPVSLDRLREVLEALPRPR
ncbi:MAG: response regulator [Candidatus Rokubacteria bacterium]|nr:response regulator [Candidatus Rokubacteria bacterium]